MAVFPENIYMSRGKKKVLIWQTCDISVQDEGKHGKHGVDGGVANHEKTLVERHRREVEHGGKDCLARFNHQMT